MAEMDLGAVWLIISNEIRDKKKDVGGGICVDGSGLIFTSCYLLGSSPRSIRGRCGSHDSELRKLEIVKLWPNVDLALLKVFSNENEVFAHITLDSTLELNSLEEIFAVLHQGRIPFSLKIGNVCFPFPPNVDIEPCTTDKNLVASQLENVKMNYREKIMSQHCTCTCRTLGCVIDVNEKIDELDYVAKNLHPDLPLVQVQGLGWLVGTIGCPIFVRRKDKYVFVGQLCFEKGFFEYAIPCTLLQHFLNSLGPLDSLRKGKVV